MSGSIVDSVFLYCPRTIKAVISMCPQLETIAFTIHGSMYTHELEILSASELQAILNSKLPKVL